LLCVIIAFDSDNKIILILSYFFYLADICQCKYGPASDDFQNLLITSFPKIHLL